MKLWQKENTTNAAIIERFTVGNDRQWDLLLAEYDVLATIAHTQMLFDIALLNEDELQQIQNALQQLLQEIKAGTFTIQEEAEDIHSQLEWMLTNRIGEAGKKIHSGRSRNDQVLVAIKLYLKNEIQALTRLIQGFFENLMQLSDTHQHKLLPGYTHLQIAMPSSFGLWFGAYAESLVDDMELLLAAYHIANKNPLGSAAGYGNSFPLNRELTTALLGFADLNYNVVYAQMTRGKTEKTLAMAMASVAATLSKFAYDICLYLNQNFNFISFPDNLTTGSSIMPHKKNPDVFELIRGKCNKIQALPNELTLLTNNLPSGYHRDLQLTKEALFPAILTLKDCITMFDFMIAQVQVKEDILNNPLYEPIFSVDAVNNKVQQGVPFREAYQQVASDIGAGRFTPPNKITHTHAGSMGNLCNDKITANMKKLVDAILN